MIRADKIQENNSLSKYLKQFLKPKLNKRNNEESSMFLESYE